jgi:polyhydroxyalkanoate synthesis repressor PhaR
MAGQPSVQTASIVIKRYGGRRLYNTNTLQYVSADDLVDMVVGGQRFIVRDAATGYDVTREILERLH